MKIGIDARLWGETGVGRYIRALVFNLSKIDIKNQYVLFMLRKDIDTVSLPPSWEIIAADVSWHSLEEQIKLPEIFKNANPDLMHIPYFSAPIFSAIPFIVTIHDLILSHRATGKATTQPLPLYMLKRLAYKLILHQSLRKAQHIICVSETVKKQLILQYNIRPEKISVTYEAGELEQTSNDKTFETLTNYILYVGNAHPHKNIENLINAFEILSKKRPDLSLVLIGKNDYFYQRLVSFIKDKNLLKKIILPGAVSNNELKKWYKNALCFVFPSLEEGFGIPGLEAMTMGCPVAVSNIDVFHEIYGQAAIYFDQHDPLDMANKLDKVIQNIKFRNDLIKDGISKSRQYGWQKMARETLSIYENSYSLRSLK